jgi:hypothetical protein
MVAAAAALQAWDGDLIRLKNRTIDPHRCAVEPCPARAVPAQRGRLPQHYIVQFRSSPGAEIRDELARRRIRVLAYVPESALMVVAAGPLDLRGMEVAWTGSLEAADKLSPALSTEPAGAWLVIFHADVEMERARALAFEYGYGILDSPRLLTGQLLIAGSYGRLAEFAGRDEVSYILPASPDLVAGLPVTGCGGPLTEAGPIAEYALVGSGWAPEAGGGVNLKYFFQTLTGKVEQDKVRSEFERAFGEWTRYANLSFSAAAQAQGTRSIDIRFARGAHGDAYPFDGAGGVLAHTFYPSPPNAETIAGDMHFDDDEPWHAGTDVDLFTVALHEAGHALGLGHSDRPGSVMYPYYRFASGLTNDDIAAIRRLYGPAGTQPAGPPAQPPTQPPVQPPTQPPVTPPAQPPTGGDTTPPWVRILSPGITIVSTSSASIAISGTAGDNAGVVAVKWSTSTGAAGNAAGTAAWSANVPLLVGDNVVTVRAYDASGNSGWRSVTVVRR